MLQEFYCLVPGVLGIEALARGNAVLMPASHDLNPELPADCADAWVVTPYWRIHDHLKALLDHPARAEEYALRGRAFVERHYSFAAARASYQADFASHGVPFERVESR